MMGWLWVIEDIIVYVEFNGFYVFYVIVFVFCRWFVFNKGLVKFLFLKVY